MSLGDWGDIATILTSLGIIGIAIQAYYARSSAVSVQEDVINSQKALAIAQKDLVNSQQALAIAQKDIINSQQALAIAQKGLDADHERSRREKTVDILFEWDQRLKKEGALARRIVETFSAEQCRELHAQSPILVNAKLEPLLKQLFNEGFKVENNIISLNEGHSSELRWYVITYLNALESVLVAWQYSIVDREIIEHQFSYLFKPCDGHEGLKHFRVAAGGEESYPAIEIFASHILEKRRAKLVQKANVA
ncbi:hypothetical protein B9T26_13765 [Acinetobacter sp. ANC 4169]|uniref:hypothetical protein n=1 Tax=Acinetobacter sp. ANC 4169 TaxID=1977879 RepID=UPI000A35041B|nr:hypothetical protein [Acinetobacter sp. ANC 4169]OTG70454.1 hypothetical protein B9T26_13765 [Acinetobacter sp. ANC 4169]